MATQSEHSAQDDLIREAEEELLASKRQMWDGFVRFSTYSIIAVAVILLGMALFLL